MALVFDMNLRLLGNSVSHKRLIHGRFAKDIVGEDWHKYRPIGEEQLDARIGNMRLRSDNGFSSCVGPIHRLATETSPAFYALSFTRCVRAKSGEHLIVSLVTPTDKAVVESTRHEVIWL
jgi:hypothetical protein